MKYGQNLRVLSPVFPDFINEELLDRIAGFLESRSKDSDVAFEHLGELFEAVSEARGQHDGLKNEERSIGENLNRCKRDNHYVTKNIPSRYSEVMSRYNQY